jgi:hypothetical protein
MKKVIGPTVAALFMAGCAAQFPRSEEECAKEWQDMMAAQQRAAGFMLGGYNSVVSTPSGHPDNAEAEQLCQKQRNRRIVAAPQRL